MASILQQGCVILCPHGGQVMVSPAQSKTKATGFILVDGDATQVVGCPFTVGPKYQPCVSVEWQALSTKVKANGKAVLLDSSVGLCKSAEGTPQGTAMVQAPQMKAKAT